MRRILIRVTDRRLTVSLFLAFLLLFCLGLVLPQRPLMLSDEAAAFAEQWPTLDRIVTATGLDDVYRSTLMKVVFGTCVVQLLGWVVLRARPVFRESFRPAIESPDAMPIRVQVAGSTAHRDDIVRALRSRRFAVREAPDGTWFGVKNRFSGISSLVFHTSFVLILGGAWLLKASMFSGSMILAEGQPFRGTLAEYEFVDPAGIQEEDLPALQFTPERLTPVFTSEGNTVDLACEVLTGADAGTPAHLAANRPLSLGGADILVHGFGLAPVFTVQDARTGRDLDAQCVKLSVWAPGLPEDSFRLERPPATVHAQFFPDHVEGTDGHRSQAMEMRNPAMYVRVVPDEEGFPAAEGLLKAGQSLDFGGYRLTLAELRRWGNFHVSRQSGWLLIAGFLVMVVSITLRFFFDRQAVSVQLIESDGGEELVVGGRAAFFPEGLRHRLEMLVAGAQSNHAASSRDMEENHGIS